MFKLKFGDGTKPSFIFNTDAGEQSPWKHIPTVLLPPCSAPRGFEGVCLRQTGPQQELVRAAILLGENFTRDQLVEILSSASVETEKRPKSMRKPELVEAVVQHFFPDLPKEEQDSIKERMCANSSNTKKLDCPQDVVEAVSEMDVSEVKHFDKLREQAKEQLEHIKNKLLETVFEEKFQAKAAKQRAQHEPVPHPEEPPPFVPAPPGPGAGVAREAPPAKERAEVRTRTVSPQELKDCLPDVPGLFLRWEPNYRRVAVNFSRSWFCV